MRRFTLGYPNFLEPPVFRPPSEADSLILQATLGCSHNACTFCGSYRTKQFQVKPFKQFRNEVLKLSRTYHLQPRRIFLGDGDALVLSTSQLLEILQLLKTEFPSTERISIYASGSNVLRKSDKDLHQIQEAGLDLIYLGLESGDDEILRRVNKGITNQKQINACLRLKKAGFILSIIIILGLGGKTRSLEHAQNTATSINVIDPEYLAALTLMIVPGTELFEETQRGDFKLLSAIEILQELRVLIEHLSDLTHCTFRTNHASNYLPLRGVLSKDRERLMATIDSVLKDPEAEKHLRPEYIRGL